MSFFARPLARCAVVAVVAAVSSTVTSTAKADVILFTDASGLAAEAEFTLLNGGNTLQLRLRNTSTGAPAGFEGAPQLLTGISWDAGAVGANVGDITITGGSAVIGANSSSINFDSGVYGPGSDIGGEWGFNNTAMSGMLAQQVSALEANTSQAFGGADLDGPNGLDGPQGGLVANPAVAPLGGIGAIQNEILVTLSLSAAAPNLSALLGNGVRVEFGSDAFFINVPAPGALAMFALAGIAPSRRRRR